MKKNQRSSLPDSLQSFEVIELEESLLEDVCGADCGDNCKCNDDCPINVGNCPDSSSSTIGVGGF